MSAEDVKALQIALGGMSDRLKTLEESVAELGRSLASVTEKALRHDTFIGKVKVCAVIGATLLFGILIGMGIMEAKDVANFVKP